MKKPPKLIVFVSVVVIVWTIASLPFAWHETRRAATVLRHAWGCEP